MKFIRAAFVGIVIFAATALPSLADWSWGGSGGTGGNGGAGPGCSTTWDGC